MANHKYKLTEMSKTASKEEAEKEFDSPYETFKVGQVKFSDDGTSKSFGNGTCYSASNMHLIIQLNPEMRTTPTLDYTSGSDYYDMFRDNAADQFDSFVLQTTSHKRAVDLFASGGASGSQGASALLRTNNSDAKIRFSAEL